MADVKSTKNRGIPLKIDGATRFVRGATKYTTCSDVIKMVLKKTGIGKEYRHLFAIYEISKDGERTIPCKSRILKVMEGWDNELNKFVLRKTDPLGNVPFLTDGMKNKCRSKSLQRGNPSLDTFPVDKTDNVRLQKCDKKETVKFTTHNDLPSKGIVYSTSESDSSLEDFISKVDHSKMAGFIDFFNAVTMRETNTRTSGRTRHESSTTTDSDNSYKTTYQKREHKHKAGNTFSRYSSLRRAHKHFKHHRSELNDKHPNKVHGIKTVDYGMLDDVRDKLESTTQLNFTHENDLPPNRKAPKKAGKAFLLKRYIAQTNKTSHNLENSSKPTIRHSSGTHDEEKVSACNYKYANIDMVSKCREIWDENLREENDSGHDDVTDSDLEAMCRKDKSYSNTDSDVIGEYRNITTSSSHSSVHKLVDYSITDDEFTDNDGDDDYDYRNVNDDYDNGAYSDSTRGHADDENSGSSFEERIPTLDTNYERDANESNNNDNGSKMLNISNMSDYIRGIFGRQRMTNEDEEMDSFMKSKIFDESSSDDDEGLCSLGSGSEKDVKL